MTLTRLDHRLPTGGETVVSKYIIKHLYLLTNFDVPLIEASFQIEKFKMLLMNKTCYSEMRFHFDGPLCTLHCGRCQH